MKSDVRLVLESGSKTSGFDKWVHRKDDDLAW